MDEYQNNDLTTALKRYGICTDDLTLSEMIILIEMFMILVQLSKIMWLSDG